MKKSGFPVLVLALLLGGGAGYFLFQHMGERSVVQVPPSDPYGQLGGQDSPAPDAVPVPPKPPGTRSETIPPDAPKKEPKRETPQPEVKKAPEPAPPEVSPAPKPVAALLPKPEQVTDVQFTGPVPAHADGWYELGMKARTAGDHRKAAKAFAQAAALNPSAANWRALADEQVALGDFVAATRAFEQAAAQYRKNGDDMTARAVEHLAAPYRQTLDVLQVVPKAGGTQEKLAKFEPPRGVLLGIHVNGNGVEGAWGKEPRMAAQLRPFAVAFRYWKFTKSTDPAVVFPGRFARAAKGNGMALHLALEPGMPLNQINDDIIKRFAQQAKAADLPIFVRFASEMNDPNNAWASDPTLYRKTFRRVAEILHQDAPNVAMVWMPMPGDLNVMQQYYPGPDAVDWAGLSLYSVPFENGDLSKPRLGTHPLETIDAFYKQYAPRHPIQLSEYASSNRSGASPNQDFSEYAAQQLREVYWGAWLKYPRLKNINWLDIDMHAGDSNGKTQHRLNDYRLLSNPAKRSAYQQIQQETAFHQRFNQSQCRTCQVNTPRPWPTSMTAGQTINGALWLQTAKPIARVVVGLDGQQIEVTQQLPHHFTIKPTPGKHHLQIWAISQDDKILMQSEKVFVAK